MYQAQKEADQSRKKLRGSIITGTKLASKLISTVIQHYSTSTLLYTTDQQQTNLQLLSDCITDVKQSSILPLPQFFSSWVVFLCFHPQLVSLLFTGPCPLVLNVHKKFAHTLYFFFDAGKPPHKELRWYLLVALINNGQKHFLRQINYNQRWACTKYR